MDPNQALKDLREQVAAIREAIDGEDKELSLEEREEEVWNQANELVDSFDGLDRWLSKKGFLPKDWER